MKKTVKKVTLSVCMILVAVACGIIIPSNSPESDLNINAYADEYSGVCSAEFEDSCTHENETIDTEAEYNGCCYDEESDIQVSESIATPYNAS